MTKLQRIFFKLLAPARPTAYYKIEPFTWKITGFSRKFEDFSSKLKVFFGNSMFFGKLKDFAETQETQKLRK